MSTTPCPAPTLASRRALRRRRLAVGASAAALLSMTAWAPMALATHYQASLDGNNLQDPSLFEIDTDANLSLDDSPTKTSPTDVVMLHDWGNVAQTFNVDKRNGTGDDSYAGGVKEDTACPGETTDSIPPNKSDLLQFGAWEEAGSPGYLHLYWIRVNNPTGTTLMDFEFNQSEDDCASGPNKVRTAGDLLIEYAIDQGGARADMTLRSWTGSQWGPATDVDADNNAAGTINQTAIAAGQDTLDLDGDGDMEALPGMSPRTFGEASIDLNLIFQEAKCTSFGSAMLKSRSSDSFTSQLKDFVAPIPLELSNCGKVIIHKETVPEEATDLFGFTKSFTTDPTTPNSFQLDGVTDAVPDSNTKAFLNVVIGSGYTVDETSLPAGWQFDSVDCGASVGVTPTVNGSLVTFAIDATTDVLECTYTNKALASLTIVKQVSDASGGEIFPFTTSTNLDADGFSLTPSGTGAAGQATTGTSYHNIAPGSYTVAETVPAGWNLVSQACTGGVDTNPADGINLVAGESLTCTFVNARERGAIDITKLRKHAAAADGEGPHAGVTFTVTSDDYADVDVDVVTAADGTACVDGLLYGDYTVTETVPENYVSADEAQDVAVSAEADCGDEAAADVSFMNTPLTDVTVSVDSLVEGGTASTISCVDGAGTLVDEDLTNAPGDVSLTIEDLEPTAPTATLLCTIVVDP